MVVNFELVGEEYPIPILQSCLIQLQREVRCLEGIDFEITKPRSGFISYDSSDAVVKTRKLHKWIQKRLQRAAASPLDSRFDSQVHTAIGRPRATDEAPRSPDDRDPAKLVEPPGAQHVFQWNGRRWRLKFGGGDIEPLPALDGLFYIHFLVEHRPKRFSPSALRGEKHKFLGAISQSADQQSEIPSARDFASVNAANNRTNELVEKREDLARVQARLTNVNNELEDAAEFRNEDKASQLQKEKEQLEDHLKKATGIRGKIRLEANQAKKDRDAVRKAIVTAIANLPIEAAAVHFKKSIPLEDTEFCYEPEHPIDWLM